MTDYAGVVAVSVQLRYPANYGKTGQTIGIQIRVPEGYSDNGDPNATWFAVLFDVFGNYSQIQGMRIGGQNGFPVNHFFDPLFGVDRIQGRNGSHAPRTVFARVSGSHDYSGAQAMHLDMFADYLGSDTRGTVSAVLQALPEDPNNGSELLETSAEIEVLGDDVYVKPLSEGRLGDAPPRLALIRFATGQPIGWWIRSPQNEYLSVRFARTSEESSLFRCPPMLPQSGDAEEPVSVIGRLPYSRKDLAVGRTQWAQGCFSRPTRPHVAPGSRVGFRRPQFQPPPAGGRNWNGASHQAVYVCIFAALLMALSVVWRCSGRRWRISAQTGPVRQVPGKYPTGVQGTSATTRLVSVEELKTLVGKLQQMLRNAKPLDSKTSAVLKNRYTYFQTTLSDARGVLAQPSPDEVREITNRIKKCLKSGLPRNTRSLSPNPDDIESSYVVRAPMRPQRPRRSKSPPKTGPASTTTTTTVREQKPQYEVVFSSELLRHELDSKHGHVIQKIKDDRFFRLLLSGQMRLPTGSFLEEMTRISGPIYHKTLHGSTVFMQRFQKEGVTQVSIVGVGYHREPKYEGTFYNPYTGRTNWVSQISLI
ncbi:MAG: hypothetical protein AAF355_09805 [Myxococcota bacterium]